MFNNYYLQNKVLSLQKYKNHYWGELCTGSVTPEQGPGHNPHKTLKKIGTIIAHSSFFAKIEHHTCFLFFCNLHSCVFWGKLDQCGNHPLPLS